MTRSYGLRDIPVRATNQPRTRLELEAEEHHLRLQVARLTGELESERRECGTLRAQLEQAKQHVYYLGDALACCEALVRGDMVVAREHADAALALRSCADGVHAGVDVDDDRACACGAMVLR